MKAACIILTILICVAMMAVCVMVKFATDVSVEERTRELSAMVGGVYQLPKAMAVIALSDNGSIQAGERFPYVGAIIRNTSTSSWAFACFASIILMNWAITAAHCRKPASRHRILLYRDFIQNYTHTYPVLFWRLHEKYNSSNPSPQYDIAVAKLNVDNYPPFMRSSVFDGKIPNTILETSVWKTVASMDKRLYLTNDFESYQGVEVNSIRCFESFGYDLGEGMFCLDYSRYEDCFIHEFGPVYSGDKLVGILAMKPRDCDVKLAVFTNVSHYAQWILKSTHVTFYG